MTTKKRAIVLLQSNYVGLFDCQHTPNYLYMGPYNSVPPFPQVKNPWFYSGKKYSWQQNVMLYYYLKMWIVIVHVYFILNVFQVMVATI